MPNQHLVKRDAAYFFDPSKMKQVKKGKTMRLIQTKIGANPFKLDQNNRPVRIQIGDVIWLMETGYGVYAKSKITAISDTFRLRTREQFAEMRKANDPYCIDLYWRHVNRKFERAKKSGKALHVVFVEHTILNDSDHYYVRPRNGARNDWITFENSSEARKWITNDAPIKAALKQAASNGAMYTQITPLVKYKVSAIWKIPSLNELDFDHFVPKSVGAPGIFEENVVPFQYSLNRAKSNRIPQELIAVACDQKEKFKGLNLTEEVLKNWDQNAKRGVKYEFQKRWARKITNQVSRWPEQEQRKFYFSVLKKAFNSTDAITRFEKNMNKPVKYFTKKELIGAIESLRSDLRLDLEDMFKNASSDSIG